MIGKKRTRTKNRQSESFLTKLYDILNSANYRNIISWDEEGKKLLIFDSMKLSNEVLPKFYKHRNYSSFIRQLNLYGFHKTKGINEKIEKYEHEKFDKNITKEEIKQIANNTRHNNIIKNINSFIYNNKEEETKDTDLFHLCDDKILNYLTKKIDENNKYLNESKKDIEKLKNEINNLNNELLKCKFIINNNKIIISKLIQNSVKNYGNRSYEKIINIKELFKRYLFYLKIYSPFVEIDFNKIIKQKERRNYYTNNNYGINYNKININNEVLNNSRDNDDLSFLNGSNNIQFFDLNMLNINHTNSFINNRFYK